MTSKEMFIISKDYIPGGVSSPVRAYEPYPFFVKKGHGSRIYDVDGNEYIDHCLAYGPLVLGHANEKITHTISHQLKLGTPY